MLILDLRLVLFLVLLAVVLAGLFGAWVTIRMHNVFGAVLEYAPFGVLRLRSGGRFSNANAYARQLLQIGANGPLPDTLWSDLMLKDWFLVRSATDEAGGQLHRLILPTERAVAWWVVPDCHGALVFLLDTTEQYELQESSHRLMNDLAHELRTPLATLLTHAEVLHLPSLVLQARDQSIELVRAEGRRMSRLLNQMLELGRLEVGGEILMRPLDFGRVVANVIEHLRDEMEAHDLELIVDMDPALPLLNGDSDRLRQVLLNLVSNTIKYCRPRDTVLVTAYAEAKGVRCVVCDSGPGISAQHLPHLTQRFYRATSQAVEGSGLGLALVKEVLTRHHSKLEIVSKTEGEAADNCSRPPDTNTRAHPESHIRIPFETGTCFSFLLPDVCGGTKQ